MSNLEFGNPLGHISEFNSKEAIVKLVRSPEFSKLGVVNKDLIDVCKDCEFRYMCVDDRIPVEYEAGKWKMETDCQYSPYKNEWR